MADLTITAANIIAATGAAISEGTAGETITAGMALYKDAADSNSLKGAQHDGTEAQAECVGIALNGAADGQPVSYITRGTLAMGSILTAGVTYVVGAGAGGIAPDADVGSTDYKTVLGVALSASNLAVNLNVSGVALA
jgi:hypothetical protein